MTEPRRREEDLGSENRADQYHAVDGAAQGAEHCAEERRVAEPGGIRAPDHRADHYSRAECAEEDGDPAAYARPHRQHVSKASRLSAADLPGGTDLMFNGHARSWRQLSNYKSLELPIWATLAG
jgi:hypothetical protein